MEVIKTSKIGKQVGECSNRKLSRSGHCWKGESWKSEGEMNSLKNAGLGGAGEIFGVIKLRLERVGRKCE